MVMCCCIFWLVVEPPLWKIWKSVGTMIPNLWTKCCKPPNSFCNILLYNTRVKRGHQIFHTIKALRTRMLEFWMIWGGCCEWSRATPVGFGHPSVAGQRHKDQQEEASSDVSESPPGLDCDVCWLGHEGDRDYTIIPIISNRQYMAMTCCNYQFERLWYPWVILDCKNNQPL